MGLFKVVNFCPNGMHPVELSVSIFVSWGVHVFADVCTTVVNTLLPTNSRRRPAACIRQHTVGARKGRGDVPPRRVGSTIQDDFLTEISSRSDCKFVDI